MSQKIKGFLVAADAIVPCPHKGCNAAEGQPCHKVKDERLHRGDVHFGRRLKRLLLTAKKPHEREALEAEAVKLLKEYLKEKK